MGIAGKLCLIPAGGMRALLGWRGLGCELLQALPNSCRMWFKAHICCGQAVLRSRGATCGFDEQFSFAINSLLFGNLQQELVSLLKTLRRWVVCPGVGV